MFILCSTQFINKIIGIYNPYSESNVQRVWGNVQEAEKHSDWVKRTGNNKLENVADDDYIIFIKPGETILAHTNEFIGGRTTVTTMMKARSSLGRNFIEVCKVNNHNIILSILFKLYFSL